MRSLITILFVFVTGMLCAQPLDNIIKTGNDAYKKRDYKTATDLYKKALAKEADNLTAKFNLGNAYERQNKIFEAAKYYDDVAGTTGDEALKAKALYNRALAYVKEQKLPDAIETFKQSLKLEPSDNETRENLQKAINDLKKQQQSQPPPKQNQKPQKNKKNKQPDKDMMEQKFDELRDKEKQLQKMLQKKPNSFQPDKDW